MFADDMGMNVVRIDAAVAAHQAAESSRVQRCAGAEDKLREPWRVYGYLSADNAEIGAPTV